MRVLYFTQGYSPHDQRFLTALAGTTHEIHFARLDSRNNFQIPGKVTEIQFPFDHPRNRLELPKFSRYFRQMVDELKPDIVHAGPIPGPAFVAALAGVKPLVTMSWGSDILYHAERSLVTRLITGYVLRRSTALAADCQTVANKAVAYGFPADHIFLFPWGVDLEYFHPKGKTELRSRLGWEKNFIVFSNRSFELVYGVDIIIKAFIQAQQRTPVLRLLLFGSGSQETKLRKMLEEAGVMDKVYFGGYASRDDLPGIYRSADFFVSASHSDGSSVSLIEALACGTPALVSDIPSNLEWVAEGQQGWTFKDYDVDDLEKQMVSISQLKKLLIFKSNARETAEFKADWSKNFPVLLQAYEFAVAEGKRTTR